MPAARDGMLRGLGRAVVCAARVSRAGASRGAAVPGGPRSGIASVRSSATGRRGTDGEGADDSRAQPKSGANVSRNSSEPVGEKTGSTASQSDKTNDKSPRDTATRPRPDAFPVYMDVQATTPLDPRVLDAMLPYMVERFGNPHSRTHAYGWEAEAAVEGARAQVASLLRAEPRDVVFTSGATEANNTAIKGAARFCRAADAKKKHIVTSAIEHKCVLDACRALEQDEGFRVTYVRVDERGVVDVGEIERAIVPGETALVSIMAVNNEIGAVQPLADIGALCRRHGVLFHSDAAQAAGRIPIDVQEMGLDLVSLSGHKVYGPKGVGALYVRRRPRVRLSPLLSGGGQERGIRSGTVPVPLVVGLGAACDLAASEMASDAAHAAALSARLLAGISAAVPCVSRNGAPGACVPHCVNVSFAHVEGESLLMALKDVALSSGSACTSASLEPSYVLRALGRDDVQAHSSLRFGLGRFTTADEVDFVVRLVVQHVARLRDLSPLWEMAQEGIDVNAIEWSAH